MRINQTTRSQIIAFQHIIKVNIKSDFDLDTPVGDRVLIFGVMGLITLVELMMFGNDFLVGLMNDSAITIKQIITSYSGLSGDQCGDRMPKK
jgi:hypothetical protein